MQQIYVEVLMMLLLIFYILDFDHFNSLSQYRTENDKNPGNMADSKLLNYK